jgi:hypothetical protein
MPRQLAASVVAASLLVAIVYLLVGQSLLVAQATGVGSEKADRAKPVTLAVDFMDGAQKRLTNIPWNNGMTVLDVMNHAAKHRHGIQFTFRGKGARAFLTRIDDLENQGAAGRNWIFHVNQKQGDRSFAVFRLEPGDAVLWKFDKSP